MCRPGQVPVFKVLRYRSRYTQKFVVNWTCLVPHVHFSCLVSSFIRILAHFKVNTDILSSRSYLKLSYFSSFQPGRSTVGFPCNMMEGFSNCPLVSLAQMSTRSFFYFKNPLFLIAKRFSQIHYSLLPSISSHSCLKASSAFASYFEDTVPFLYVRSYEPKMCPALLDVN